MPPSFSNIIWWADDLDSNGPSSFMTVFWAFFFIFAWHLSSLKLVFLGVILSLIPQCSVATPFLPSFVWKPLLLEVRLLRMPSPLSIALGLGFRYTNENAFGGSDPGRVYKGAGEKPSWFNRSLLTEGYVTEPPVYASGHILLPLLVLMFVWLHRKLLQLNNHRKANFQKKASVVLLS